MPYFWTTARYEWVLAPTVGLQDRAARGVDDGAAGVYTESRCLRSLPRMKAENERWLPWTLELHITHGPQIGTYFPDLVRAPVTLCRNPNRP
jgi:hypothetical protein